MAGVGMAGVGTVGTGKVLSVDGMLIPEEIKAFCLQLIQMERRKLMPPNLPYPQAGHVNLRGWVSIDLKKNVIDQFSWFLLIFYDCRPVLMVDEQGKWYAVMLMFVDYFNQVQDKSCSPRVSVPFTTIVLQRKYVNPPDWVLDIAALHGVKFFTNGETFTPFLPQIQSVEQIVQAAEDAGVVFE